MKPSSTHRHLLAAALTVVLSLSFTTTFAAAAHAADGDTVYQPEALVFTPVLQNPITPIKNQYRSGTCWAYATVAFLESELLRKTQKTYNLSEMFVASHDYVDCATYHVRLHGDSRFSEGGSADDVLDVISRHGICPEDAMTLPGGMLGDTLADFNEFFPLLEAYVGAVAKSSAKRLTPQWRQGMQSILDAYLGPCPAQFTYEGQTYTPQSFAKAIGIDPSEYISVTSFTHHPLHSWFVIEAPYKWRPKPSYNLPLNDMMSLIDHALEAGFTVAWGGDVSEDGFTRDGLAIACETADILRLTGMKQSQWDNLSRTEKAQRIHQCGTAVKEQTPTQELRQQRFDQREATYDHVMLIYGKATDQQGRPYYMVKNSWGDTGKYHGTWYMSRNYIALNTTYVFLSRQALPEDVLQAVAR